MNKKVVKYSEFIKESNKSYSYGCVMLDIDISPTDWKELTSIIDEKDLYLGEDESLDNFGIEDEPHITLLYGLHNDVTLKDVKSVFDKESIKIKLDGISLFENDDFDVVKFDVSKTKDILEANEKLTKFPHTNSYPDYKPHATLAYVKKGKGKKYIDKSFKREFKSNSHITYSLANGNKERFYLNQKCESFKMNEKKMWYKSIPEFLNIIENLNYKWTFVDTETTGLGGPNKEQITQLSAITYEYVYKNNKLYKVDYFDKKIKLNKDTKDRLNSEDSPREVLKFNKYGSGDYEYMDEKEVIESFLDDYLGLYHHKNSILFIQNAEFDLSMIGGRYGNKIENEVFDTKEIIRLYFLPLIQKLSETDTKYKDMVNKIGTSSRDNGLLSSSLSKIGPALGINMKGYHDALKDCQITSEVVINIIGLLKDNKDVDISKYQVERIKSIRK